MTTIHILAITLMVADASQTIGQDTSQRAKAPAETQSAELGRSPLDKNRNADAFAVDAKLQWKWSSNQVKPWTLKLSVAPEDTGQLLDLENHCESVDSATSFRLAEDRRSVVFVSPSRTDFGELQIRFVGSSSASLQLEMVDGVTLDEKKSDRLAANSASNNRTISVEQLLRGGQLSVVDDSRPDKPTLSLSRAQGDELSVEFDDESIHRETGEAFSLIAKAKALAKIRSTDLKLKYRLYRVSDGKLVAQDDYLIAVDQHGNSPSVEVAGKAPDQPGVYEVRCQLADESSAIWSRIRRLEQIVATSQTALIVQRPAESDPNFTSVQADRIEWDLVGEIRPGKKSEWEMRQWLPDGFGQSSLYSSAKDSSVHHVAVPQSGSRRVGLAQAKHGGQVVSLLEPKGTYKTRLPRLTIGKPHRLTVRYPAGQRLSLQVDISTEQGFGGNHDSFTLRDVPAIANDDGWQTQSVLFYPTHRDQSVRLTSTSSGQINSFESISVHIGRVATAGSTPLAGSVPADASDLGAGIVPMSSSRVTLSHSRHAMLRLNDFDWLQSLTDDVSNQPHLSGFAPSSVAAYRLLVGAERLKQYLSQAGYNAVSIPGNRDARFLYRTNQFAPQVSPSGLRREHLAMLLRAMLNSDVRVYVGVDPSIVAETRHQLLNPAKQRELSRWLAELDQQCIVHKAYAGMVLALPDDRSLSVAHHARSISEAQLRRFLSETDFGGAKTPSADAAVSQVRSWVFAQAGDQLVRWVDLQCIAVCQRMASELRGQMLLMGAPSTTAVQDSKQLIIVKACDGNLTSAVASTAESASSRWPHSNPNAVRLAVSLESQHTNHRVDLAVSDEQLCNSRLVEVVCRMDPQWVIVNQDTLSMHWDDSCAKTLKEFRSLPIQSWNSVASLQVEGETNPTAETTFVRHANFNGQSIVTVSNLAPWKTDVLMHTQAASQWRTETSSVNLVNQAGAVSLSIPPGTMIVLQASNPNGASPIRTWTSRVSGGDGAITQIKDKVTTVVKQIGTLSQPPSDMAAYAALSNGGFEQASPFEQAGTTTIAGWMHTQHPANAIRLDQDQSIEGKKSIVLTTDPMQAGKTWIVSEQFLPPESGRLAVSLAVRGELVAGDTSKQKIQVSLEGTRDGEPIRHSQMVLLDRDGKWQERRVVLEAKNINPDAVDSLRLTVDSLSRGRVWIDDIQLHDQFPLASERRKLQDEAFMAVQGLQHGSLTHASLLLQNHWALQLLQREATVQTGHLMATESIASGGWSPSQRAPVAARRNTSAAELDTQPLEVRRMRGGATKTRKPPSVAERIKGWIPQPLRF